ncbi:MAG: ExbD/TolR family protein [bacterium]
MGNGGTIIRLVDVALIILFGFIVISRLHTSEIMLPTEVEPTDEKQELYVLRVNIMHDSRNRTDSFQLFDQSGKTEIATFSRIQDLESPLLAEHKRRNGTRQVVVLIEPDKQSMIQHTVDVLDLCKKHGIPRNINYKSLAL